MNRGTEGTATKTILRKHVEYTTLWNAKSSKEERKVVRRVSGMREGAIAGMLGAIP